MKATKFTFKRILITALAVLLLATGLMSCAGRGKTLMKLGSSTLSVNAYQLILTRMKGELARSLGTQVMSDSFWNTTIGKEGRTWNDYYTSMALDTAKSYLVALYLYEKNNLFLSDSVISAVDKEMEGLIVGDGDGSKSQLNQILSAYGVNYDILREIYLSEKKIAQLKAYLYGSNAEQIASNVKNEYMKENYLCFRQIFMASYYYVYEQDAYGNKVYYSSNGKSYLYDTENGVTKNDANGQTIKDKYGNPIYYDAEGNILYDTKNGTPVRAQDSNGNYKTEDYKEADLLKIEQNIELLASQITDGDFEDFEDLMKEYSEDEEGMTEYKNGYFLEKNTSYGYQYLNDISAALAEMKVGETKLIESDYGYHLIMKYDCEDGAYEDKDNEIWFRDFNKLLVEFMFLQETQKYTDQIEIDKELLGTLDMKSVSHNYYY